MPLLCCGRLRWSSLKSCWKVSRANFAWWCAFIRPKASISGRLTLARKRFETPTGIAQNFRKSLSNEVPSTRSSKRAGWF